MHFTDFFFVGGVGGYRHVKSDLDVRRLRGRVLMGIGGLEIEFQSRGRFVGRKGGEGGKKWNDDAGWWGDV